MVLPEEERAAAFRAQEAARARSLAERRRSLHGDPGRRAALTQAWRPWTDAQPDVVEPVATCDPPTNADPGGTDCDQLRPRRPRLISNSLAI